MIQPKSFTEAGDGTVLIADGLDHARQWDGVSTSFTQAGIDPPASAAIIAGSGSGTIDGTYVAFYAWVDAAGVESSLSPVSNQLTVSNVAQINYSALPNTAPTGAVLKRLYRTTDGQQRVAWLEVETVNLTGTTDTGTMTDATLRTQPAVALLDDKNRDATRRRDPPPDHKPYMVWHLQRMYALGVTPYSEGSVGLTSGSKVVVGTGTEWPDTFAGRFLYTGAGASGYEIDTIDTATQTITLLAAYSGATDKYASYTVSPAPALENLVYFSEAGESLHWPAISAFELPEDNDVVTGGLSLGSYLYVMKRARLYRFTVQTDPEDDGFLFPAADRGCCNHRCAVVVGATAYLLDERGAYKFDGGEPETISGQIQDAFRRDARKPINWRAVKFFHGVADPARDCVLWFVCLRGDVGPRHALCYNYRLGRWWEAELPYPVYASDYGWSRLPAGKVPYLGGPAGVAFAYGEADGDGLASGGGLYGVLSAGVASVTISPATLPVPSLVGVPIAVARGRGRGQVRVAVSAAGAVLRLDRPWLVRPDATSVLAAGGVPYRYRTHQFDLPDAEVESERSFRVEFLPRPGETADFKYRPDGSAEWVAAGVDADPRENYGVRSVKGRAEMEMDLGNRPGTARARFDGRREGNTFAAFMIDFEVSGVSGGKPHAFNKVEIKGAS